MANLRYNLVQFDDTATLTVFHDGVPLVANNEHPNWDAILQGVVVNDDPSVVDLFDITRTVAEKFQRLGSRVTARDNRIYFDGDEVVNALTKKILEFVKAGVDDWIPLVKFMEKVFDNPEEHSRAQLFDWLMNHAFSINEDGDILGYKGVTNASPEYAELGFKYQSIQSGVNEVTVDDKVFTGHVPLNVGSVVEMARSEVAHDPANGCGPGLHVSNFRYASNWTSVDKVLLVAVSPRDVVSVPTESNWEKVRVNRYRVVEEVDAEKTRYEDESPLHVEQPKTYAVGDFHPGQVVRLVKDEWIFCGKPIEGDLEASFGLTVGDHYVVIEDKWPADPDNVLLNGGTGTPYGTCVSPNAIVPVEEDEEEEESWGYDDDEDSWSW